MIRNIAIIVGLLMLGWVGLHFLTKVGTADVIAYNDFQRPAESGARQLLAGDSVVVYDDGHMERLCDLNLGAENFNETDLTSRYVNTLAEALPFFDRVATVFRRIVTDDAVQHGQDSGSVTGTRIDFVGKERSLREVEGAPTPQSCLCRMARFASLGNLVCTVNSALIQTVLAETPSGPQVSSKTVAVTLARHPVIFQSELLSACNVQPVAPARQSYCNDGEIDMPLDVWARQRLNLIDERPFTPVALHMQ